MCYFLNQSLIWGPDPMAPTFIRETFEKTQYHLPLYAVTLGGKMQVSPQAPQERDSSSSDETSRCWAAL